MKKSRKAKGKIKNIILNAVMSIVFFVFAYSACCLDAEGTWMPLIVCAISFCLLAVFAYLNGAMD